MVIILYFFTTYFIIQHQRSVSLIIVVVFLAEQNHDAPPDRQTGCTRFGEEVSQGKRHKLHVITDHLYIYIVDKKIDIKSSLYS